MNTSSGSVDANVVLRPLLNDIPEQHQAATRLLSQARGPYAMADTALMEVAFVLERSYRLSRKAILEAIGGFSSLVEIKCDKALLEKALSLFATLSSCAPRREP